MREILLHGGPDEAFDRSVVFARRMAESFGARLHVLYTVEDPLSAGWTAEVSAERLPEVHDAIDDEARERLARAAFRSKTRSGSASSSSSAPGRRPRNWSATTEEHTSISRSCRCADGDDDTGLAHALLERGRCAVLVLR